MPTHLPAFLATTLLLSMLPGPGQALMTRQTLLGGRRAAWATIAGNSTGIVLWSFAASAGLSAVLLANPQALEVVRLVGGAVLVWLGISTLRASRKSNATAEGGGAVRSWKGFAVGLGTNLGNAKAGVFAVSMLPQFVTDGGSLLVSGTVLGLVWALVTAAWYVAFTWAVGRGRRLVSRPAVQRGLQVTTGGVLLVLGVAVASGL
ncbi:MULTISPECIES: LysE family translocator [unclassified Streptomyces]|uniref:LysE family translocator n=1 Tax=unclassified Streptomyces TaxID=2593676 RepID=UPI002E19E546|nr:MULTISPECIES: LysE family translocator [unclassified Streptomyces]